ncbi:unnamed protein product [Cylindrotheca closterium]|uniref:GH18 domain-containing protein n=1 Tax=Cylindrotheca closterium TaxID=2856 RepID=A0AAD2CYL9_9STRA|nr:unnamed protein product [Cylindrotheca closterium]
MEILPLLFRIINLAVAFLSTSAHGSHNEIVIDENDNETIRPLPSKVIVGYSHLCDDGKAETAIRDGVNVLIWSFMGIDSRTGATGNLNLECIRKLISDMDEEGYDDTVHLVSFGGWDGQHLDETIDAKVWFHIWRQEVGTIFHGLDFDLEGNDDLSSPRNEFSLETLDMMGRICQLAKQDGFIVSMAPPQSYLDISTSRFSRFVNLTHPDRHWHSDFQYFGANVYAHTLAKYGDYVDLVQIQFYESYARAAMEVLYHKISPEGYLSFYNLHLVGKNETFLVNFESDPLVGLPSQDVALPLSKLVWGFGNGWVDTPNDKNVYFPPDSIAAAYNALKELRIEPRGFMFWCVGEEGRNGVYYAKALNEVLHIRSSPGAEA